MHLVLCLMELKHKLDHKLRGILTNDSSKKSIVTSVIKSLTSVMHECGNLPCGFISLIHPGEDL